VARSRYEEALAISRELGDRWGIAAWLNNLGLIAYRQGEYGAARSLHEESLSISHELGDRLSIAGSLEALAELACEEPGQPGAGGGARPGGAAPEVDAADNAGAGWRAARLYGAGEALREAIGAPVSLNQQEEYRRQVSRVLEMLGEEEFAAAWAEGRAMTPDQAIAYALQGAGGHLEP
jgi:hypothetical protein